MAKLIADSGATKTDWCVFGPDRRKSRQTEGLNPYYHSIESIREVLKSQLMEDLDPEEIDAVYFYGAGCDSKAKIQMMREALKPAFGRAGVYVHHDLLGAARACFLDEPGIACILGTGSNSCLYDGREIVEHIPSLAFILGDEGSAGYFGKKLINTYFRYELPDSLKENLESEHDMSLDHITQGVYEGTQKSRFVASYGSFLGKHKDHPFIRRMLREGFENFVTRIVKKYPDAEEYEVRFIGSVACAHRALIREILEENGLTPGAFIEDPMERLVEFHSNVEFREKDSD